MLEHLPPQGSFQSLETDGDPGPWPWGVGSAGQHGPQCEQSSGGPGHPALTREEETAGRAWSALPASSPDARPGLAGPHGRLHVHSLLRAPARPALPAIGPRAFLLTLLQCVEHFSSSAKSSWRPRPQPSEWHRWAHQKTPAQGPVTALSSAHQLGSQTWPPASQDWPAEVSPLRRGPGRAPSKQPGCSGAEILLEPAAARPDGASPA